MQSLLSRTGTDDWQLHAGEREGHLKRSSYKPEANRKELRGENEESHLVVDNLRSLFSPRGWSPHPFPSQARGQGFISMAQNLLGPQFSFQLKQTKQKRKRKTNPKNPRFPAGERSRGWFDGLSAAKESSKSSQQSSFPSSLSGCLPKLRLTLVSLVSVIQPSVVLWCIF